MVQHKVKQKVNLPKGVQQRKSTKRRAPDVQRLKKGVRQMIKPKTQAKMEQHKVTVAVSKHINSNNEQMVQSRANQAVGKFAPSSAASSSTSK